MIDTLARATNGFLVRVQVEECFGGAPGGVPGPVRIVPLTPEMAAQGEEVPSVTAEPLQPKMVSGQDEPKVTAENIRPILIGRE